MKLREEHRLTLQKNCQRHPSAIYLPAGQILHPRLEGKVKDSFLISG